MVAIFTATTLVAVVVLQRTPYALTGTDIVDGLKFHLPPNFTVAFAVAYLLTGSVGIASALALIEPMANTIAFFFHERAWSRVTLRLGGGETTLASASK
jgi:uncharacterized membrane protein